jgi:predicted ArsR family transcriptional regulator
VAAQEPDGERSLHQALADERRARIVDELRGASGGLDVRELGERVGLHPNTVRWHLGLLADAGLVASEPAERVSPGRPRILYRLTAQAVPATQRTEEYRLLASILTGTLAERDGAAADAERNGRAWGRYLARRPLPLAPPSRERAVAQVSDLLAGQGFEPAVEGGRICMYRCPFHDLAETNPDIICAVHRGMIDGTLEELGSDLRVAKLDVFPRPDVCIVDLDS